MPKRQTESLVTERGLSKRAKECFSVPFLPPDSSDNMKPVPPQAQLSKLSLTCGTGIPSATAPAGRRQQSTLQPGSSRFQPVLEGSTVEPHFLGLLAPPLLQVSGNICCLVRPKSQRCPLDGSPIR